MKHAAIQKLVSCFLDGEVRPEEESIVKDHLKKCHECTAFVRDAGMYRNGIQSSGTVDLPHSFPAAIVSAVEQKEKWTDEWLGIEPFARNTCAALTIFVLVLLFLGDLTKRPESSVHDQFLNVISGDSATVNILQQENLSKNDLLYAVVTSDIPRGQE